MIRSLTDKYPEPYNKESNIASRLMREFERLADERGLVVSTLSSIKNREGMELNREQRIRLFRRYGFECIDYPTFCRRPKSKNN